ncbi:hypothetical protein J4218_01205 [Candidatus Pacearchaeota archaeon]|nr:hypothetical protein [Candidatus Pacearchaeota archaeon]
MKILFSISSLGLGHALRTLPIIKEFMLKNEIMILSHGKALSILKDELKNNKIEFIDFEDYPPLERGNGLKFYYFLIKDIFETKKIVKKENKFVNKLIKEKNINLIISDGRYGSYSKKIKSFIISHQIKIIMPKSLKIFQMISDLVNYSCLKEFNMILIPDFEDSKNNLAGKMSHNWIVNNLPHKYIGILSSYTKTKTKEDIDYYFITSGYIPNTKKDFIEELIKKSKLLNGKKVFVLGETFSKSHSENKEDNIEIYPYVSGKLRNDLMNRSKVVISRSGYTTIMDLIELGKRAIITPTQNQVEQEYLADYLDKKNLFPSFNFKNFNMINMVEKAKNSNLLKFKEKTKDSIKKIINTINSINNKKILQ